LREAIGAELVDEQGRHGDSAAAASLDVFLAAGRLRLLDAGGNGDLRPVEVYVFPTQRDDLAAA